jgi:isocitrate dehydrogenase
VVGAQPDFVQARLRREVGMDVFVESALLPEELGRNLELLTEASPLRLKMISNRGTKVYPASGAMTDCVDHWRCRFILRNPDSELDNPQALDLLQRIGTVYRWMHVERLLKIDGAPGYTKAQGED